MPEWQVARWDDRTVEDLIRPYTDHPATITLFGFLLGLFFVLPYWEVSAGEAIWSFRRMVRDNALSYPIGGTSTIPETYCRLASLHGAEIRTGVGVRRIAVEDRRVRGVELDDGSFLDAEIVVSTSSLRTTVLRLVGEAAFPESYVARARSIRASYIATQAKIALKKKLIDAGSLVGGFGDMTGLFDLRTPQLKEMFQSVLEGRVPPVVPFYCPVPSNFDPNLAPPGCQLLTLCSVAPTTDIALEDPGPRWEEAMMRSIRAVIPDLDRHVIFVDRFSVGFIEHWIGKDFGPAISTGQVPGQVGAQRPKVATPVAGLYLAGCGAGARGVGTELAAASAMECADQVRADLPELIARARSGRRVEAEAS
jgi:prolycopene isomerase